MIRRCECGRRARVFRRVRKRSARSARSGQPVQIKGHWQCPECFQKSVDANRRVKDADGS